MKSCKSIRWSIQAQNKKTTSKYFVAVKIYKLHGRNTTKLQNENNKSILRFWDLKGNWIIPFLSKTGAPHAYSNSKDKNALRGSATQIWKSFKCTRRSHNLGITIPFPVLRFTAAGSVQTFIFQTSTFPNKQIHLPPQAWHLVSNRADPRIVY